MLGGYLQRARTALGGFPGVARAGLVFGALLVVFLWVAFALVISRERDLIVQAQFSQNLNLARAFEENVARTLAAADLVLRDLEAGYLRSGRKFAVERFALERRDASIPYTLFGIVNEDADVAVQYPMPARRLDLRNNDNFKFHAARNTRELFISTPRKGSTTGRWEFFVSRRINKADGSFGGFASVGIDVGYLAAFYDRIDLGKEALIMLVGRDGVIRARGASAGPSAGDNIGNAPAFRKEMLAKDQGSLVVTSSVDAIRRLVSFKAMKDYPLIVAVGTSESAALAVLRERRNAYAGIMVVVSLVILGFSAITAIQTRRRSRAAAEVRKLNAELERRVAERTAMLETANRELETFNYSVSHDLKAPLRGIAGYSSLLLEDYGTALNDEGRGYLKNIRLAAQHMGELIDDLLAYSRLERSELQRAPVSLRPLVEQLLAERADELGGRRAAVDLVLPAGANILCDRDGLMIALRNLLENALKFTNTAAEPRIEIGAKRGDGVWRLWVRDNGIGFDMQYHDRIFGIFQRLHRSDQYPGTGVGLAIVKKAMQRVGGRVWAESAPGEGATFYLEIPT